MKKADKKKLDAYMRDEAAKKKREEEQAKKLKKEQRKKEREERKLRKEKKKDKKDDRKRSKTASLEHIRVEKGGRSNTSSPAVARTVSADVSAYPKLELEVKPSPLSARKESSGAPPASPNTQNSMQQRVQSMALKKASEDNKKAATSDAVMVSAQDPRRIASTEPAPAANNRAKAAVAADSAQPRRRESLIGERRNSANDLSGNANANANAAVAASSSAGDTPSRLRNSRVGTGGLGAQIDRSAANPGRPINNSNWGINTMRRKRLGQTDAASTSPQTVPSPASGTGSGISKPAEQQPPISPRAEEQKAIPASSIPTPTPTPTPTQIPEVEPAKPTASEKTESTDSTPTKSVVEEKKGSIIVELGAGLSNSGVVSIASPAVSALQSSHEFNAGRRHSEPWHTHQNSGFAQEDAVANDQFGKSSEEVQERMGWSAFIQTTIPNAPPTTATDLSRSMRYPTLKKSMTTIGATTTRRRKKVKEKRSDNDQQRLERDANIILGAFKKQIEEKKPEPAEAEVSDAPAAPPAPPMPPPPPPGAEEHKATRVNMLGASGDEFYQALFGVPKELFEKVSGMYKWRIENMQPVLQYHPGFSPESAEAQGLLQLHQVYIKDCYLFLNVVVPKDEMITRPGAAEEQPESVSDVSSKVPTYHLHYWMGKEATPDKLGTVCVRAVQLNTYLSGAATHHPEPQGEESSMFNEYFGGSGVEVEQGGTDSPFRKVPPIQDFPTGPRLYRFFQVGDEDVQRIGRNFQIKRVDLASHWFHDERYREDVFLIDTGLSMFQWSGQFAPGWLLHKCADLAQAIRTERQSKPVFQLLDSKKETIEKSDAWPIIEAADKLAAESDQVEYEKRAKPLRIGESAEKWMQLHKIMGSSQGDIDQSLVWSNTDEKQLLPSKNMLSTDCVFILDLYSEVFIFYGRRSTNYLRQIGLLLANKILAEDDVARPEWAQVEEVKEKAESVLFRARFDKWTDEAEAGVHQKKDFRSAHEVIMDEIRKRGARKAAITPPRLDPATLFPARKEAEEAEASDSSKSTDGATSKSGLAQGETMAMGLLESGKGFIKIGEQELGQFFSAECYVIIQTREHKVDDEEGESVKKIWDIWFWQGKDASPLRFPTFQLGLLPQLQESIARTLADPPTVHKVYQEKEPVEFMRLFAGMIVISQGLRKDAFSKQGYEVMYRALHSAEGGGETRMLEVSVDKQSLDATGTFLLHIPPSTFYIWHGRKASQNTRNSVKDYLDLGDEGSQQEDDPDMPKIRTVEDGKEPPEFWEELGTTAPETGSDEIGNARLLEFKYVTGKFEAKEVVDFSQADLLASRCYMLDSFTSGPLAELWFWLGSEVPDPLVNGARHVVKTYAEWRESQGHPRGEVQDVQEGKEEADFTKYFRNWTRSVFVDPYEERQKEWRAKELAEMQAQAYAALKQAQAQAQVVTDTGTVDFDKLERERIDNEYDSDSDESETESTTTASSDDSEDDVEPEESAAKSDSEDDQNAQRLKELRAQREQSAQRLQELQERREESTREAEILRELEEKRREAALRIKALEERRREQQEQAERDSEELQRSLEHVTPKNSPASSGSGRKKKKKSTKE